MYIAQNNTTCQDTLYRTITVSGTGTPNAQFTMTGNDGVSPCAVTFTNTSTNAISSVWDFGDGTTATDIAPAHTYAKGGNYRVKLTVQSAFGLSDTAIATVNVYFGFKKKSNLRIQLINTLPNGTYHVFYKDGSYQSSILDKNGTGFSQVVSYALPAQCSFSSGATTPDGGFVMVGTNFATNKAVVAKISGQQELQWLQELSYGNTALYSYGTEIAITPDGETVICGLATLTSNTRAPGYARIGTDGNIRTNIILSEALLLGTEARSIAITEAGSLLLTCNQPNPTEWATAYLLSLELDGSVQKVTPYRATIPSPGITHLNGLRSVGNHLFMVKCGRHQSDYYLDLINEAGETISSLKVANNSNAYYTMTTDNQLILLQLEGYKISCTKVDITDLSSIIWQKTDYPTLGSPITKQLLPCPDGGFLFFTTDAVGGDQFIFKIDENGNWR